MIINRFCGDCKRLRTVNCERTWTLGMMGEDKRGNRYYLQNPTDYARNCMSYEEVDNPKYSLLYEKELKEESLKYGGKIVWV